MITNYLFVRLFETDATVKLSKDLDDFQNFCHYSSLSDWPSHKKIIADCLDKGGQYIFDGNDVHYYILTHPTWMEFEDENGERFDAPTVELKVE
jgi:hypothetical protein